MAEDLLIPPADVRIFLEEAERALQCTRVRTSFGKRTSTHWYYIALGYDNVVIPFIVTLEVRRTGGVERIYLDQVRPPTAEELAEIGAQQETATQTISRSEARKAVRAALSSARAALDSAVQMEEVRRGVLAYDGAVLGGA